jgi:hypothetical protein
MIANILNCRSAEECLKLIVTIFLIVLIQMLVLRFLWNNALVKHVSILKPITTLLDAFILSLGMTLLRN